MKKYLGVKLISAEPALRGWQYKGTEPLTMEEFKQEGYRVIYEDGYESWSPKDVFERAYREIGDISVGAIAQRIAKTTTPISFPKSRMVEELGTLVAREEKLESYVATKDFEMLPTEIQNLLVLQLNAMKCYLSVLIERFDKME